MISLWRWIIVRVIVVLIVSSSLWAEARTDAKVTKRFKVNWSSASYDKTLNNPKVSPRNRQFIGQDDKPVQHTSGFRRVPASVGGRGSGGGSHMDRIEKIRFVIAVNPAHYKIPFELEHIPLPEP